MLENIYYLWRQFDIMTSQQMRRKIQIRVPEEDIQRLDAIAEQRRTSREAILRESILDMIAKSEA